jgi:hypothetical protein
MKKLLLATSMLAWLPVEASANLVLDYSVNGGATFTPICSAASGTSCGCQLHHEQRPRPRIPGHVLQQPRLARAGRHPLPPCRLTNPTGLTRRRSWHR